jgi:uncharacterized membrane protein YidH (DUF202 family)
MQKIGFVLVIIGAIMMFYTGFNYVTTEKIVDISHRDKQTTKKSSGTMVTNLSVVLIIGGVVIYCQG